MHHTTFGRRTGLRVSEYALGAANFGTGPGAPADPKEAKAIFGEFLDAGGTFIDTADRYQNGESEVVLSDLIAADRDRLVLSTKYTRGDGRNAAVSENGNGRKTMIRSLEASLRRLNTDYVDVYWVHLPDGVTPVEEIVAAFDDLVRAGKILHGGLSNFPAWRVAVAATLADLRDRAPIIGIQVEYNLADRTAERELLPMAEALGLGAALYAPLAGGLLTGKYRGGEVRRRPGVRTEDQRTGAVLDAVIDVAGEWGTSAAQISMAWLRARAARSPTAMIPVIGPRTAAQLGEYLATLNLTLADEQYARLERASAVALGTPHESVAAALPSIFGGDISLMHRHPVPVV